MKKLTILMIFAAVGMAVAAAALVAAVRFAADSAPEIVDSVVGQASTALEDAVNIPTLPSELAQLEADGTSTALALPARTSVGAPSDINAIGPAAGTAMAVVGVRRDDVLNIRDAPSGNIIARLSPMLGEGRGHEIDVLAPDNDTVLAITDLVGVKATGETELLPTTTWHKVNIGGVVGWASDAYLAPLGQGAAELSDLLQRNLGQSDSYATVADIEQRISDVIDVVEPDAERIVISPVEFFEGTGAHWLDVIGVRDDRLRGYRVGVDVRAGGDWMVPDAATSAGPFTSLDVWATELCLNARGTDQDGKCR